MREHNTETLAVVAGSEQYLAQAQALAAHLGVRCTDHAEETAELMLRMDDRGLVLTDGTLELAGDFTKALPRLRPSNLNRELLVKAAKIKGNAAPVAVDATAGLGDDAILLAAAGFTVYLYEYDAVIAALLADALRRAREHPALAEIAGRMHLTEGSSIEALPQLDFAPDVVMLDPMFPERQKSAMVKKKFQLLQKLERPCAEEDELLRAAMAAKPHKIVIKRPAKGPLLAGRKPSYSIGGKAIRYDCLVFA